MFHSKALQINGDRRMGKTTLLAHYAADALKAGTRVTGIFPMSTHKNLFLDVLTPMIDDAALLKKLSLTTSRAVPYDLTGVTVVDETNYVLDPLQFKAIYRNVVRDNGRLIFTTDVNDPSTEQYTTAIYEIDESARDLFKTTA